MHVEKKGERGGREGEGGREREGGREGERGREGGREREGGRGREGEHDSLNFEAKDKKGGDKVLQLTHS